MFDASITSSSSSGKIIGLASIGSNGTSGVMIKLHFSSSDPPAASEYPEEPLGVATISQSPTRPLFSDRIPQFNSIVRPHVDLHTTSLNATHVIFSFL